MTENKYIIPYLVVFLTICDVFCFAQQLFPYNNTTLNRNKRQSDQCRTQFLCKTTSDCIRYEQVCDGTKNCPDDSDEDSEICADFKPAEPVFFGKFACSPPSIPNGKVTIIYPNADDLNKVYNAGQLRITCNRGFVQYKDVVPPSCIFTDYWQYLPTCKRDCSPLISTNLIKINCTQDYQPHNCSTSVREGTTASFTCKEFYKPTKNSSKTLKCEANGVWNSTFFECEPECGHKMSEKEFELYVHERREFPWQVSISRGLNVRVEVMCRGIIITPLILLSAAHCFTDEKGRRYPANQHFVRTSNENAEVNEIQSRNVKSYYIPRSYRGKASNFEGDLAVVVLEKPFELSDVVHPICIDWDKTVEPQEFSPDKLINIDNEMKDGNYTERIQYAKDRISNWRFINYQQCKDAVPKNMIELITQDKFCAKSTTGDQICEPTLRGDGLVYADKDDKYYLRGILGGKLLCNGNALYTDIYLHKDFIFEVINSQVIEDECGELTSDGATYVVNGQNSIKNSFPWHIGLYRLNKEEYDYKCGGSIISPSLVITAAHCVTNEAGVGFPAEEFYVAAGKYYSDYDSPEDSFAQKRQVKEYYIPSEYVGYHTNYAGDLAVLILKHRFQFTNVVKPICMDWTNSFESNHLQNNKIGSVVGWGSTDSRKIKKSEELKQLNTPFIDIKQCLDGVPSNFRRWITSDKFCAGYTNGSSVCKGDSGGGLVFKRSVNNKELYYIRGVVSVGPSDRRKFLACNNFKYGVYTKISAYVNFILDVKEKNEN